MMYPLIFWSVEKKRTDPNLNWIKQSMKQLNNLKTKRLFMKDDDIQILYDYK